MGVAPGVAPPTCGLSTRPNSPTSRMQPTGANEGACLCRKRGVVTARAAVGGAGGGASGLVLAPPPGSMALWARPSVVTPPAVPPTWRSGL